MPLLCERLFARGSVIRTSKCCINKQKIRVQTSSPSSPSCRRGTSNTRKGPERALALKYVIIDKRQLAPLPPGLKGGGKRSHLSKTTHDYCKIKPQEQENSKAKSVPAVFVPEIGKGLNSLDLSSFSWGSGPFLHSRTGGTHLLRCVKSNRRKLKTHKVPSGLFF